MEKLNISTWDEARWAEEFTVLLEEARNHIRRDPTLREVFAIKTTQGNTYYQDVTWEGEYWTPGDHRGDAACIAQLEKNHDTEVACIVCLWNDSRGTDRLPQPSPTSWYFNHILLQINPNNENAMLLLWCGGEDYTYKPLKIVVPPKK